MHTPSIALGDRGGGRDAVDELHRHPGATEVVAAEVPNFDHTIEARARHALRFELKTRARLASFVDLGAQPLDDDEATLEHVHTQVDISYGALAERSNLPVGATGHGLHATKSAHDRES